MPRRRLSLPEPIVVERQEQIDELCARCLAEGRFAFDTEFVMEDRYTPEVCLIQIATEESVAVIDPFLDIDLEALWHLVSDANVETIVHAGQEDLAHGVQATNRAPRRIFDVQLAAGFAGYEYPLSLQRLVQATLHIRLHKSKTLTDWRRRPLTPAQISYGAEDVAHLLPIYRMLRDRLNQRGRLPWAREELGRFEDMSLYRLTTQDKAMRLKGTGAFPGQQLAIVRDLLIWREEVAERVNRPPRTVLKDHLLVEIARHSLRSVGEIRELRGLNLGNRDVEAIGRLVERTLALPEEDWPVPAPREVEPPQDASLVPLTTAVIRAYCLENDIAYGLVATQKSIRELIGHCARGKPADPSEVELLSGWRGKSVGSVLEDVLAGRRAVRVVREDGTWSVRVSPEDEGKEAGET